METLDLTGNRLVYGGSESFFSNRAIELAKDLKPVEDDINMKIYYNIKNCVSFDALLEILDDMVDKNINFVGTRGYVYLTKNMILLVKENFDYIVKGVFDKQEAVNIMISSSTLYTRCCLLRQQACNLILNELDVG